MFDEFNTTKKRPNHQTTNRKKQIGRILKKNGKGDLFFKLTKKIIVILYYKISVQSYKRFENRIMILKKHTHSIWQ